MKKMVSPLKNARNFGSAKEGSGHWWSQRLSALCLIFLVGWIVYTLLYLPPINVSNVLLLLQAPLNAFLLSLLFAALFYHGTLGIQVVIEDYVHNHFAKFLLLIGFKLAALLAVVGSIFTIITFYVRA